jgi:hypothetical protein
VSDDDYVLAIEDVRDERVHVGRTPRDFEPWPKSVKEGRHVLPAFGLCGALRRDPLLERRLPYVKVGRHLRIDEQELRAFIDGGRVSRDTLRLLHVAGRACDRLYTGGDDRWVEGAEDKAQDLSLRQRLLVSEASARYPLDKWIGISVPTPI